MQNFKRFYVKDWLSLWMLKLSHALNTTRSKCNRPSHRNSNIAIWRKYFLKFFFSDEYNDKSNLSFINYSLWSESNLERPIPRKKHKLSQQLLSIKRKCESQKKGKWEEMTLVYLINPKEFTIELRLLLRLIIKVCKHSLQSYA